MRVSTRGVGQGGGVSGESLGGTEEVARTRGRWGGDSSGRPPDRCEGGAS